MNFADKWKIIDSVFYQAREIPLFYLLFWGGKQWKFFININMHMTAEKNIMQFHLGNFHLIEKARAYKYLQIHRYRYICIHAHMSMYRSFLIYWTRLIRFVTSFLQNHCWKIFLVSSAMFVLPIVHKFILVFPALRLLHWWGGSCTDQLSPGCETGFLHGPKDQGEQATQCAKILSV